MSEPIAVLIMAAGKASRFGACKQLQPFGDSTVLQQLVDKVNSIVSSQVSLHTFVVTGCYHEAISQQIKGAQFIYNSQWQEGLGNSIACGVRTLADDQSVEYAGVMILLADQVAISVNQFSKLLSHFSGKNIVCARYDGANGVPALFPRSDFTLLQALTGDTGAKRLLNAKPPEANVEVSRVNMSEAAIDIDTPDDWRNQLANVEPL